MSAVRAFLSDVVPVLSEPALARQHSVHHHYRFARQHGLPVRAENFAPGLYAYAPDAYARAFATRETNLRRSALRQNDWSQGGFGQNNWSQNSFNQSTPLDGMASAQASANGVPVSLVERVIKRESGGNPRAQNRGNYGLMQIRLGTARAMGFTGSAAELLDPQVNMTYAVRYLAGAYRAAGGNESRAVALYASGYFLALRKASRRMRPRRARASSAPRRSIARGITGAARCSQCRVGTAMQWPSRVGKIVRARCPRGSASTDDFAHPTFTTPRPRSPRSETVPAPGGRS